MVRMAGTGTESGATRRWRAVLAVVGVAAVMVVLGLAARCAWLPGYRPALGSGETFGVDVSNHQGAIAWDRVAADGMTFAYIKATEGGDFVDDRFAANWDGARAVGLDRGAYHFFTLCRPGAEQADTFLRVVPRDPGTLPPVVDLELGGNCAARPGRDWIDREVRAFVDRVEAATGQTVVLYLLDDFAGDITLDRPVWQRRILRRPDDDRWWIWQVSGFARVDGIDGPADLDVRRGDRPVR
jgi:lysozyme